jgi:hypothetical protein
MLHVESLTIYTSLIMLLIGVGLENPNLTTKASMIRKNVFLIASGFDI